jgi:hypothetical protein
MTPIGVIKMKMANTTACVIANGGLVDRCGNA